MATRRKKKKPVKKVSKKKVSKKKKSYKKPTIRMQGNLRLLTAEY